jgi:serine/threonine-protein kinase RsbW
MSAPAARAPSASPNNRVRPMPGPDTGAHHRDGRYLRSGAGQGASVVELRVAARPRMVATVRATAAHLAGRADFNIDTISDLRLAVDEACGSLVSVTSASATLECRFSAAEDEMNVLVGAVAEAPASLDTTGFGWQFLRALTDHVELESGAEDQPGWIAIRFAVRDARRPS